MTPLRGRLASREGDSRTSVPSVGEWIAGEADRDRGNVPEVGEGMEKRCLRRDVADDDEEVREPESRRKQVGGKRSDREEAVTDPYVARVRVGRIHCAEADSDQEAGSDDECRPDVSCGERDRRGTPAEATLNWSDDQREKHCPLSEAPPTARPERARDEDCGRVHEQVGEGSC